jgi:hypothetical protein
MTFIDYLVIFQSVLVLILGRKLAINAQIALDLWLKWLKLEHYHDCSHISMTGRHPKEFVTQIEEKD